MLCSVIFWSSISHPWDLLFAPLLVISSQHSSETSIHKHVQMYSTYKLPHSTAQDTDNQICIQMYSNQTHCRC